MKKIIIMLALLLGSAAIMPQQVKAQSIADLLEQLALDYQKLAGLKNILSQMYRGYEMLTKGYNAVRDVAKGNFDIHQVYLDSLLLVSPAVREYPRTRDVISNQHALVAEYHSAYERFRKDKNFSPEEIAYISKVYNKLVDASQQNLDELSLVVTDSKLRMSDAERLAAIDRIYTGSTVQLTFLRRFNDRNLRTTVQRAGDNGDRENIKTLYGIQ